MAIRPQWRVSRLPRVALLSGTTRTAGTAAWRIAVRRARAITGVEHVEFVVISSVDLWQPKAGANGESRCRSKP